MLDRPALAVAGVHDVAALLMRTLVRVERIDDAHLVRNFRRLRQVSADLHPVRTRRDRCRRPHHILLFRFRIEGVEMAHAP